MSLADVTPAMTITTNQMGQLDRDGYTILGQVHSRNACQQIIAEVTEAMEIREGDAIAVGQGRVVGGRNLLSLWSGWRRVVQQESVMSLINRAMGPSAGVVRILYFDKPPGDGWSLPMHKDRTIAVKRHLDPPTPFKKPTKKAGVPHVEATEALLSRMLTLRLHLDPMHGDNGPLVVVPGSHEGESDLAIETIRCDAGDVFVMRPLLSHGSRAAKSDTTDHRRVVHLELAALHELPGEYEWHQFVPCSI